VTVLLVATDLDGTLLRSDGTVSDRTRSAIAAAVARGLQVVFVTGRPTRWLAGLDEATGHAGITVASNGAVLYDLAGHAVLREHPLRPVELATITELLRAAFPNARFAAEHGADFVFEPDYQPTWEINPPESGSWSMRAVSLTELVAEPAVKLLVKDLAADPDQYLAEAVGLLAGSATITHSSPFGLLEIAAPGVTKASGLAEVAQLRGVTAAQVAAVGDMPNDLPMLAWAGRSYAVANAHPAVLDAADKILARNDDDAVADLLDSLRG